MKDEILWTALVTAASAAGAALGYHLAEELWRAYWHRDPPARPRWSQLLIGNPIKKRVHAAARSHTI